MLNAETIGEFERQYLSFEANCADEVSSWVSGRHKGFRSTPLERPRTGPVARFARAELDEVSLVNFRWYQGFESEILEDLEAFFVCVPHAGKMKMQLARNDEIVQTTDELRVFKRNAGMKNTVAPGFSNLSLVVPSTLLEQRLQSRIGGTLSEPLSFLPLVDADGGTGRPLVTLITHLLTVFNHSSECLDNQIVKADIKEHLISVMLECLPHNYCEIEGAGRQEALPKSLKRAEDFMRAHCDQPLTLADIAREAGCSERALQIAFRSHRQSGPMAVLREYRLQGAHQDIVLSEQSVTDIAYKWGFTNLGRFARIYANKYGNTPSQAVKQSRCTMD